MSKRTIDEIETAIQTEISTAAAEWGVRSAEANVIAEETKLAAKVANSAVRKAKKSGEAIDEKKTAKAANKASRDAARNAAWLAGKTTHMQLDATKKIYPYEHLRYNHVTERFTSKYGDVGASVVFGPWEPYYVQSGDFVDGRYVTRPCFPEGNGYYKAPYESKCTHDSKMICPACCLTVNHGPIWD